MEKSFSEVLGCQKHRVCHSIYKSSKLLISKNGTTQITSGSCSCLSNCSLFYKNTRIDDALPELPRFSKTKFTVVTRYARPSHEWRAITHAQDHRCHIIQFRRAIIAYLIFDKQPFRHVIIARVTIAKSKIACAKFVDFDVSQLRYMPGMKQVAESILVTFHGAAYVSRTFISFLGQLQHRPFLKKYCFTFQVVEIYV